MQRRTLLRRLLLGGMLAGALLSSLVVLPLAGEASTANNRYRAICRHGNRFWRGHVHTKYRDAERDRQLHARRCPFTDNGVITPADPFWQTP